MIEDKASVMEIGKRTSTEADELKSIELGLGMAEAGEVALELLEMTKMVALQGVRKHAHPDSSDHASSFVQ